MMVSARLVSAFTLAVQVHGDHVRKGTGVPYLTHLMAVSSLVAEYGGDEDLMIAALLHDTLEDRPDRITLPQIIARFGSRVGHVVHAKAGKTAMGGLRIDEPGTYRFWCTEKGHKKAGMTGTITVT